MSLKIQNKNYNITSESQVYEIIMLEIINDITIVWHIRI